MGWFPGAYDLRALSWTHGRVWGAAGRGCNSPAEVDIPNNARFTYEERAKRALPGQAGP